MASQHLTQQTAYWLSCFKAIGQHQGDEPAILRWLLAHPINWQREAQSPAFSLAASQWLGYGPEPSPDIMAMRVLATCGNILQQYPLGNWGEQIDLAIAAYGKVLTALPRSSHFGDRCTTLSNLATAYRHRLFGNRAENLETAISLYRQALVLTPSNDQHRLWPVALTGLAETYRERMLGQANTNLETAIAHYRQALTIMPDAAWPVARHYVKNHLAAAWVDRHHTNT
jgi:tetratricopeptide (TPR) repeat protein